MLDSWSAMVRMISSPGLNWLRMALASVVISCVVEGPKTISSGRAALTSVFTAWRPCASALAAAFETA